MSNQTTTRKRPARKAKPPAAGKAALKHVGFYMDESLYADAVAALALDAETFTDFLIDQLTRKAQEVRDARAARRKLEPRRVTELDLAKRLGKNRATVAAMRARGTFEGVFEVKGNGRVVYDLDAALRRANA